MVNSVRGTGGQATSSGARFERLLPRDAAGTLSKGGVEDVDITNTCPIGGAMIEYVYGIDLDDGVF